MVRNIEERKEVACSLASSLALVAALGYSTQVGMQDSKTWDIQVGTVVVLLLELGALQLVEACSTVEHMMAGSLASLVGEEVEAYNTVEHKMAGSLASLVGEEVVVGFHSILAVVDIELDRNIVVLEVVLDG